MEVVTTFEPWELYMFVIGLVLTVTFLVLIHIYFRDK